MDKIVHAILIDSAAKTIKVVLLGEDHLQSAYQLIGCELIEAAIRLPNGDVLFVDEEGLINGRAVGAFMFSGQVFQGRGLIVNESGEDWTAPHSPVIQLFRAIRFEPGPAEPTFSIADILAALAGGKFKVMSEHDYDAFADCLPGSLICWDWDGWTVIVAPGDSDSDGVLSIHAYKFSSTDKPSTDEAFMLERDGWQEI